MSGGSSRPLASGATAIASYWPSATQFIAAWCAVASSTVEYHTPTMCLPDRHSASLALPNPITARHCAPTRLSAVMPTVQPSRDAWPTTWSKVWIDCGRRMRGIASISPRFSNSFIAKTNERSFSRRSRSAVVLAQSSVMAFLFCDRAPYYASFLFHHMHAAPAEWRVVGELVGAPAHHRCAEIVGPQPRRLIEQIAGALEIGCEIGVERPLVDVARGEHIGRDHGFLSEQLADQRPLRAPFDRDPVKPAPFEPVARLVHYRGRRDDRGAIELVEPFEPAGEVHFVAKQGVGEALGRADIADQHLAGAEPDPGVKDRLSRHGFGRELRQEALRLQRREAGFARMVGQILGGVEERHDSVAHELVDRAAMARERPGHQLEIAPHRLDQAVGLDPLRHRGEIRNVGEMD